MSENKKEKFSYSKLSCYGNCPYNYYLTYIKHVERSQNIYGSAGGTAHELVQALEIGEITNEEAVEKWLGQMDFYEFCGEDNFPSDKAKKNYINDVKLYFKNFKPLDTKEKEVLIEKEFEIEVEGVILRGFIDLTLINHFTKEIEVIDYKTSSKNGFTKDHLTEKCRQLILYCIALQELYPDYKIIRVSFDMLKYGINEKGQVKERKDIPPDRENEYSRYFIEIPFTQENIDKFKEFVRDSLKEINTAKENDNWNVNRNNFSFFCKYLCSTSDYCESYQKYKNKYKKK